MHITQAASLAAGRPRNGEGREPDRDKAKAVDQARGCCRPGDSGRLVPALVPALPARVPARAAQAPAAAGMQQPDGR